MNDTHQHHKPLPRSPRTMDELLAVMEHAIADEYTRLWRAHITDCKTGESATTANRATEWWWTYGDGGCDCTRHLELRRALGETTEPSATVPCFDPDYPDGRYTIELVDAENSYGVKWPSGSLFNDNGAESSGERGSI